MPRTPEHQKVEQQWDDKLFEIVHQPFVWIAQQRRQQLPAEFAEAARAIVDALDRLGEYKMARDHIGNRRYDDARRNAIARFISFANAIVMGMRNR